MSLTPSVEVGLRHDGGDAETGAGMDVGAGLIVSDTSTGLAVDVRVRMLLETELGYGLPVGSRLIGTPRVDEAADLYHDVASGVRDDRPELDSRLA